jgi:hypothetical protein
VDKPKIRPVEAFPVQYQNQTMICLRDPMGFAPEPIVLAAGAYFLLTLCDGNHTFVDIQEAYARRFGDILPSDKLGELIEALDRAFFLDSPAFAARVAEVLADEAISLPVFPEMTTEERGAVVKVRRSYPVLNWAWK